jgi:ribonuclease J
VPHPFLKPYEVGVFALGGLGEVGKNMYCIEHKDEILIIDSGVMFPDDHLLGIDYVIPDYSYLIEHQDKIQALIITHGHEDHIGGIPWLLKQVKIPKIYASGIALGLIKNKMQEHPGVRLPLFAFYENDILRFNTMSVSFFRTNHSIPDSFGIVVKTPQGKIVHTGDFKFDLTPTGPDADYGKMARIGAEGVLLLLSDSTNSELKHFSKSETEISNSIKEIFASCEGRVIVATFASNIHRVQQIVEASVEMGRKIAVFGRSMERTIEVGQEMGYIKAPHGTFVGARALKHFKPEEITILSTGTQGEAFAALSRIAGGTHRDITLQPGDTVIFSSSPIPGNGLAVNKTINLLFKKQVNVIINSSLMNTHTSGHAANDELKLMLKLIKPKYFMPIHGEYRMLKIHAQTAVTTGVKENNTFVLDNGDVLAVSKSGARFAGKVQAQSVYIDGKGIGDIGSVVLRDRKMLSEEGLLSVIITLDLEKRKLLSRPTLLTRGFVYIKNNQELMNGLSDEISSFIHNALNHQKDLTVSNLKRELIRFLSDSITKKTDRNPTIMPVIMAL